MALFFEYLQESKGKSVKEFSIKDLEAITPADIENYLDYSKVNKVAGCNKFITNSALRRRFVVISAFYQFFYSEGMIECIPTLRANKPKKTKTAPVIVSDEDVFRLYLIILLMVIFHLATYGLIKLALEVEILLLFL